jgi:hypothetical protein
MKWNVETLFEILIHQEKSIVKYLKPGSEAKLFLCKEHTDYYDKVISVIVYASLQWDV